MSSTTTANTNTDDITATKQLLMELRVQRDAIDSEAHAIISELMAPSVGDDGTTLPCMGVDTPLVDADGYPRGDIDVYRARSLRQRLQQLKTDRARLQTDMDRHLQRLTLLQQPPDRQQAAQDEMQARLAVKPKPKFDPKTGKWVVTTWDGTIVGGGGGSGTAMPKSETTAAVAATESRAAPTSLAAREHPQSQQQLHQESSLSFEQHYSHVAPFARIDSVADDSPAHAAGLQIDDAIVSFDGICVSESSSDVAWLLQQVASRVARAAASNEPLVVVVVRRSAVSNNGSGQSVEVNSDNGSNTATTLHQLELRPRPWAGRGLLGCHMVPVSN